MADDPYRNPRADAIRGLDGQVSAASFTVERARLAGAMRAMAELKGFEAMKLAVEHELRRGAQSYGAKEGWIG